MGRLVEAAVCANTVRNLDGNTAVCCVLWVERPGQRRGRTLFHSSAQPDPFLTRNTL